jgi:valyl-tRNA synthetase
VLAWVLDQTLRLLHPVTPFVTEALWKQLNALAPVRGIDRLYAVRGQGAEGPRGTAAGRTNEDVAAGPRTGRCGTGSQPVDSPVENRSHSDEINPALIVAEWPKATWKRETAIERNMQALMDVIRSLREIRNHVNGIRSAARESAIRTLPRAVIKADAKLATSLMEREAMILRLGQCDAVEIGPNAEKPPESASKVLSGVEVFVPLTGLADLGIERQRLTKERNEIAGHLKRLEGKLGNEGFVSKAPAAVVEKERERLADLKEKLAAVERNLAEVGG